MVLGTNLSLGVFFRQVFGRTLWACLWACLWAPDFALAGGTQLDQFFFGRVFGHVFGRVFGRLFWP